MHKRVIVGDCCQVERDCTALGIDLERSRLEVKALQSRAAQELARIKAELARIERARAAGNVRPEWAAECEDVRSISVDKTRWDETRQVNHTISEVTKREGGGGGCGEESLGGIDSSIKHFILPNATKIIVLTYHPFNNEFSIFFRLSCMFK